MVTARYFEERMTDLVKDSDLKPVSHVTEEACEVMMETLESLGYSAGVEIFRKYLKEEEELRNEW